MQMLDELKIGENTYTKVKYSPIELADISYMFINLLSDKSDPERLQKLNNLFREALLKITINGSPVKSEIDLNNHFSKFPKELIKVRSWALLEGTKDFLASYLNPEDSDMSYWNF